MAMAKIKMQWQIQKKKNETTNYLKFKIQY